MNENDAIIRMDKNDTADGSKRNLIPCSLRSAQKYLNRPQAKGKAAQAVEDFNGTIVAP
jgi:hypothetical protein